MTWAIYTFVNGRRCSGGRHVDGLASGIASVLRQNPKLPAWVDPKQPLAGKTVVLLLRLREPQWENARTNVLAGAHVERLVREMVAKQLPGADGSQEPEKKREHRLSRVP